MIRYARAFRAAGWVLTAGGAAYLFLGLRSDGGVSAPFIILGLIAIVVGTALIRWGRRQLTP